MEHLNENGVKALTEVAEWLERGAPHVTVDSTGEIVVQFDMSEAGQASDCGTACCIAGAVVAFNPETFPQFLDVENRHWWSISSEFEGQQHGDGDVFTDTRKFLGMSEENATKLFVPDDVDLFWYDPAHGAEAIRHFIKTGVVRWPDVEEKEE